MADAILSKKEILSIMENGQINNRFSNYLDMAFLPTPLAIDVIEREKKNGTKTPSDLKKLFDYMPACVNVMSLSQFCLYDAMNDSDFSNKYINRTGHPFEFATEACIYDKDGWWDCDELIESIMELSWV